MNGNARSIARCARSNARGNARVLRESSLSIAYFQFSRPLALSLSRSPALSLSRLRALGVAANIPHHAAQMQPEYM